MIWTQYEYERRMKMLLATNDEELYDWIFNAANPDRHAGSFVQALAEAGLRADHENYQIIRPALLLIAAKYPKYSEPKVLR